MNYGPRKPLKSLAERYADLHPDRILDDPRNEDERSYADLEAQQEAEAIWNRLQRSARHRQRVATALAQMALRELPPPRAMASERLIPEGSIREDSLL